MELEKLQQVRDEATCLCTAAEIQATLDALGATISDALKDKNPLCLCVMTGGVIPTGHLLTRLDFPLQLDYIHASRYHEKTCGTELKWYKKPRHDLQDRVVLLIDDILDEGLTLSALVDYCKTQNVKEIYTAVLLDKNRPRAEGGLARADFTGRTIPNAYVFGYGLDYYGYWRNANGIYAVKPTA